MVEIADRFQSAFAGEWLEEIIKAVSGQRDVCFNPLSLENGWKIPAFDVTRPNTQFQSAFAGEWLEEGFYTPPIFCLTRFNPLSLENGWKLAKNINKK